MYIVYILWSEKRSQHYVGQTKDINDRIKRHNGGKVKSTKGGAPWVVKYSVEVLSRELAVSLERKIKKKRS